jgi:hypothetical protein
VLKKLACSIGSIALKVCSQMWQQLNYPISILLKKKSVSFHEVPPIYPPVADLGGGGTGAAPEK